MLGDVEGGEMLDGEDEEEGEVEEFGPTRTYRLMPICEFSLVTRFIELRIDLKRSSNK